MCGIVYAKSLVGKPVHKTVLEKYLAQRSRGTDGFGFYSPETDRLTHNVREGRILSLLRRNRKATEILFHHRMPTSTANVRNACHPFSTKDYFKHNYVIVHNGVLWNEDSLRREHEQRGIDYISEQDNGDFNDSEALAYDIARYLEGEVPVITAEGSIAFIAIKRTLSGKQIGVYFGRNTGNPLIMQKNKSMFTLSSEGKGTLIDPDTMYFYDYATGELSRSPCRFPSLSRSYSTGYWSGGRWQDDDEWDEVSRYNFGYGYDAYGNPLRPTAKETADHFIKEEGQDARLVNVQVQRLLMESDNDLSDAINNGWWEFGDLTKIENQLKESVEITNTASDEDVEKYYSIGDRKYYLKRAIEQLESEVHGQSRIGFRFTPDHSSRGGAREIIDPVTGFAYYRGT